MEEFVHLHVHSEYSLLDGANRIKDLPIRAKELGMPAIALTDHGVMFGAIDFYKECKKNGIKPIIGCEVYVSPRTRFEKEANIDNKHSHLILLAKNSIGYNNLIKIVSLSYTEGFYYKPRVDKELIKKYSEGLIVLSGCIAGELSQLILKNEIEQAKSIAQWYKNIFKEDYYLEIQANSTKEQAIINQKLVQIGKELEIKVVATNDAHYLKKEDSFIHDVLLCVQTGKKINDIDRLKFPTNDFYIKSYDEMAEYFKNIPQVLTNTIEIANKCNLEFEFGKTKLPNYEVPKEYKTHLEYFEKLCYKGIKNRYQTITPQIQERLEYEISIIDKMGYVDYFLIVWDFINYAKSQQIAVGPGRGSGAGSLAAYAIGITDIDPIKYNLIFERFLNPERISMPDFDVDFCYERRGEVIEYVSQKYGQEHVSQIITFGTMAAKMVIRDVARVVDTLPLYEIDKVAKMIPFAPHITIEQALKEIKELKTVYENDENIRKILEIAMKLEGLPRHASTHAAGVVITKDPVDTYVPLYASSGIISTQYTMTTLEELGLLKMDFLGLRTLTVITDTIKLVKKYRNIEVNFGKNFDDQKVFKLWQKGETVGIFQFESPGMTKFMKELKPTTLEDIIAGVSLYRPGPMDQIPRYIKNKQNSEQIEYIHPSLEPILKVTYGCMVYQEQVMQIVRELAGYSLGRADLVRRAMGKKKIDVMAKERENFIEGCAKNKIDKKSANKIFDEMAEFAKYAFNKSHAAAYSVISYQTAYLKTYYPQEFMAAMLNSFLGNLEKTPIYVEECKKMGINILKPNINESNVEFSVENGQIRFGLATIKNVGISAVETIIDIRNEKGKYVDFIDFCEKIENKNINKKCIECLIKAGAFDVFGETRATLLASFEEIIDNISETTRKIMQGQVSIFEQKYTLIKKEEMKLTELILFEKEMLGIDIQKYCLEKVITINIKNMTQEQKNQLKNFIRYYNNKENNYLIQVEEIEKIIPCGSIQITQKNLKDLTEFVGEKNIKICCIK